MVVMMTRKHQKVAAIAGLKFQPYRYVVLIHKLFQTLISCEEWAFLEKWKNTHSRSWIFQYTQENKAHSKAKYAISVGWDRKVSYFGGVLHTCIDFIFELVLLVFMVLPWYCRSVCGKKLKGRCLICSCKSILGPLLFCFVRPVRFDYALLKLMRFQNCAHFTGFLCQRASMIQTTQMIFSVSVHVVATRLQLVGTMVLSYFGTSTRGIHISKCGPHLPMNPKCRQICVLWSKLVGYPRKTCLYPAGRTATYASGT